MTKEEFEECLGDLGIGETQEYEGPEMFYEEIEEINSAARYLRQASLYSAERAFLN